MKKLNGTVIVTYRCNARCTMCNRYKAPSKPEEELSVETISKLPKMYFTNITGGQPFIREDLKDIVRELYKHSDRIVISTNGFFTDRIIDLCKEFPQIGIRISIEGLEQTNNEIRGLQDGFNRGYTTLEKLVEMGMKDVGFGMTVQDRNAPDLVPLYLLSNEMGMEFATASLHNSFYFVEAKNIIKDRQMVAQNFENLINKLLESNSPKKWFRAYFNHGLISYIYGQKRLLSCDMSFDTFFIDPYGDVMPCNGTKDKEVMGNLNEQSWDELWNATMCRNGKRELIDKYLFELTKIKESNALPLYVFSNSKIFLSEARESGFNVLDGKLGHISYQNDQQTVIKTFTDFYSISQAAKVYRIVAEGMYNTTFSLYSAFAGDADVETIIC